MNVGLYQIFHKNYSYIIQNTNQFALPALLHLENYICFSSNV